MAMEPHRRTRGSVSRGAPGRARGSAGRPRVTAQELAAATPEGRDRYIDLLRVLSLATVVVGHWLMAAVTFDPDGRPRTSNALVSVSWAEPATWLLQVMPVFFIVGGAAHWHALRNHTPTDGRYAEFVRRRAGRLLAPTAVFVLAWTAVAVAVELTGYQRGILVLALRVVAQPLWFLAVYLAVVALAPALLRLHRRFGLWVPVTMVVALLLVDIARLGFGVPYVDLANYGLLWLAAHQVGYLYADGTLVRCGLRPAWAMVATGFVGVVLLTTFGPYPVSMVGLPGAPLSNMNPPSAALLAQSTMLTGLVLVLREPVRRWLRRPKAWTVVVGANAVAMTAFLWHLTALFLVAAVFVALGVGFPVPGSLEWWVSRPVWIALLAAVTALLVAVFRRFEMPRRLNLTLLGPELNPCGRWHDRIAVCGIVLTVTGILGYAVNGFALLGGHPLRILMIELGAVGSGLALVAGWALVAVTGFRRRAGQPDPGVR